MYQKVINLNSLIVLNNKTRYYNLVGINVCLIKISNKITKY